MDHSFTWKCRAIGTDGNNGATFVNATYLGSALTSTVLTFNASGQATHPYAENSSGNPVVVTGTPGDELVVIQLPFGSVTPGQPQIVVNVEASLSNKAALSTPLAVSVDGGFSYGNDPLNDPTIDPSLFGTQTSSTVTPTLVEVTTTYLGPEEETATGPNFEKRYLVTASVASGQTIANFNLVNLLPAGMQFVALDSYSATGSTTSSTISTPSTTTPGGTLSRQFNQVVGTGGPDDASMEFTFYVPRDDSSSNPVLNLTTGAFASMTDQAYADGTWTPLNTAEPTTSVTSNTATDTLTAKSVAVQKTVVNLTNPGAVETWRPTPVHHPVPGLGFLRVREPPHDGRLLRRPTLRHVVHPYPHPHATRCHNRGGVSGG